MTSTHGQHGPRRPDYVYWDDEFADFMQTAEVNRTVKLAGKAEWARRALPEHPHVSFEGARPPYWGLPRPDGETPVRVDDVVVWGFDPKQLNTRPWFLQSDESSGDWGTR